MPGERVTAGAPRRASFAGTVRVDGPPDEVFPLFSPIGETSWVPGWAPEILHPPGSIWEEGQIFRTREEKGDAIWVVSRLDRSVHRVVYHRVEPGRWVARVEVACRPLPGGRDRAAGAGPPSPAGPATEAAVRYFFMGLSPEGEREIAAMTEEAFAAKMARWSAWLRGRRR